MCCLLRGDIVWILVVLAVFWVDVKSYFGGYFQLCDGCLKSVQCASINERFEELKGFHLKHKYLHTPFRAADDVDRLSAAKRNTQTVYR